MSSIRRRWLGRLLSGGGRPVGARRDAPGTMPPITAGSLRTAADYSWTRCQLRPAVGGGIAGRERDRIRGYVSRRCRWGRDERPGARNPDARRGNPRSIRYPRQWRHCERESGGRRIPAAITPVTGTDGQAVFVYQAPEEPTRSTDVEVTASFGGARPREQGTFNFRGMENEDRCDVTVDVQDFDGDLGRVECNPRDPDTGDLRDIVGIGGMARTIQSPGVSAWKGLQPA